MELSKEDLAVFDTNEILVEHLSAKLKSLCGSEEVRRAVLNQITQGLTNKQIVNLLKADDLLNKVIRNCPAYIREKEDLGEKLFIKISESDPKIAGKITGMILDLDLNIIHSLLTSDILLQQAIDKCKATVLSYLKEAKYKDELGGKVYETACEKYDAEVSKHLTGMLLELDIFQLEKLVINSDELQDKLKLCYETYLSHSTC